MNEARAAIVLTALPSLFLPACTNAPTCDCADPHVTVTVPADVASAVTNVVPSGPACEGAHVECTNSTNGCTAYRFDAVAEGACHVDVSFATGAAFAADLTIVASTGCCSGFYASPLSAAQIDVPELGDAGGGS